MQLDFTSNPVTTALDAFAVNPFSIVIGLALAVIIAAMLATFIRGL